jgi:hypothetical protein
MPDSQEHANPLHYNFAHVVLPFLALSNSRKFYRMTSSSAGKQFLIHIWERISNQIGINYPHDALSLSKLVLKSDIEAFLIQMPEPTSPPEAFYVVVVFRIKKNLFRTEATDARFFTLELGKNIDDQSEEYFFCEWVGAEKPSHSNLGLLRNSKKDTFIKAIEDLYDS